MGLLETVKIISEIGSIGVVIVLLFFNKNERKTYLEYIKTKNDHIERISNNFTKALDKFDQDSEERHKESMGVLRDIDKRI